MLGILSDLLPLDKRHHHSSLNSLPMNSPSCRINLSNFEIESCDRIPGCVGEVPDIHGIG
jgi:hypothetical protein